ncbi:iron chelate uptake ABC transporter family permease subunit [Bacillus alveayuensis]|jgi:iron complex transport system permease protein|uniref:iron chelate uptake ABC transporter family permease subunit n=1 Tax=Aeribacillus alveayuensis TaxID=279215 RepID=UPI0005D0F015|nr:iron chelate uptake ABC transporter family permease subunit [Bacillus alveayuensis]
MDYRARTASLLVVAGAFITIFLFIDLGGNWEYALSRRTVKIVAVLITSVAIGFSTLVFQTITNNRILTPSILGLDSLYMLLQTFLVFLFGSTHMTIMNKNINFALSIGFMILFALIFYRFLFKREGQDIYFLLLIGLIFGTLFGSLTTFMQVLIDPNEFLIVQDKMFASINNVNTDLLYVSIGAMIVVGIYSFKYFKYLDVLSLGREHAINLGVDYDFVVKRLLIIVAVFVSISTALTGPMTFLGLLVVNIAREFLKTYKHSVLATGTILFSIIALVGGQLLVERVFTFTTTLSVVINFVGGVYFIYLLLKENRSW